MTTEGNDVSMGCLDNDFVWNRFVNYDKEITVRKKYFGIERKLNSA